jgi:hypothetical protein
MKKVSISSKLPCHLWQGGNFQNTGLQPKVSFWLKPFMHVIIIPAVNGRETKIDKIFNIFLKKLYGGLCNM